MAMALHSSLAHSNQISIALVNYCARMTFRLASADTCSAGVLDATYFAHLGPAIIVRPSRVTWYTSHLSAFLCFKPKWLLRWWTMTHGHGMDCPPNSQPYQTLGCNCMQWSHYWLDQCRQRSGQSSHGNLVSNPNICWSWISIIWKWLNCFYHSRSIVLKDKLSIKHAEACTVNKCSVATLKWIMMWCWDNC